MNEQEARQQLAGTVDGMGKGIDAGIMDALVDFLVAGFRTGGSCEGHLGRGHTYPWVYFEGESNTPEGNAPQRARMDALLGEWSGQGGHCLTMWNQGIFGAFRVQAGDACQDESLLATNQSEMRAFAAFARSRS